MVKEMFFLKNRFTSTLPFLAFFTMVFGFFNSNAQGVLNLSAVTLFICSLARVFNEDVGLYNNLKKLIKSQKLLFCLILLVFICALFFTYGGLTKNAVVKLIKDLRYVSVFTFFLLVYKDKFEEYKCLLHYALLSTLAGILFLMPIMAIIRDDPIPLFLTLRYGYAFYIVLLFPFAFSTLYLSTKPIEKIACLVLSIFAFIFIIYTGSRGGLLSIIIESIIIISIVSPTLKKTSIQITLFYLIMTIFLSVAYFTVPQVKHKIDQTIHAENITSSRDKILETRYPLIMKSRTNQLFGIGYGSVAYNQYLNDNHAEKFPGGGGFSPRKNTYVYNNDEPFIFNIMYSIGFVGLIIFLSILIKNMVDIIKKIKIEKNIFNIGLLASYVGYFLSYCIFEKIFLDVFYLFSIFTAIFVTRSLDKK